MPLKLEIWLPKQFIPLSTQMPFEWEFRKFKSLENGVLHPCQIFLSLSHLKTKWGFSISFGMQPQADMADSSLDVLACLCSFPSHNLISKSRAFQRMSADASWEELKLLPLWPSGINPWADTCPPTPALTCSSHKRRAALLDSSRGKQSPKDVFSINSYWFSKKSVSVS